MTSNPGKRNDRLTTIIEAWTKNAPQVKFSGLTLEQFKAKVQPSLEARATIGSLESQITVALATRDNADADSNELVQSVINSVKGDLNYGEDSPLYGAFGFVRKSERKSGLTRASKDKPAPADKVA